jgi:hypothetical protein
MLICDYRGFPNCSQSDGPTHTQPLNLDVPHRAIVRLRMNRSVLGLIGTPPLGAGITWLLSQPPNQMAAISHVLGFFLEWDSLLSELQMARPCACGLWVVVVGPAAPLYSLEAVAAMRAAGAAPVFQHLSCMPHKKLE